MFDPLTNLPGPGDPGGSVSSGKDLGAEHAVAALRVLSEGVVVQVATGEIVSCNPAAERILGLTRDELADRTFLDPRWRAVHEDGSPFPGENHPAVETLRTGKPLRNVVMGVHIPDGSFRWISISSEPIPGSATLGASVVTTFVDLTERKAAEATLEARGSALASSINGIAMSDLAGRLTYVNDAFVRMWGYGSAEEILGTSRFEYWQDPEALAPVLEALETSGRWIGELAAKRRDGSCFQAQVVTSRVDDEGGRPTSLLASFLDVSERSRAEEALRQSEDEFRYVFENSPVGKVISSPSGEIRVNETFARMLGYEKGDLERTRWAQITHPDDVRMSQDHADRVLSGAETTARFVKRYIRKDGSVLWGDVSTAMRRDASGRPLYFMTNVLDVSERVKAEEALRASEERFRNLFDRHSAPMLLIEPESGLILDANNAAASFYGYAKATLGSMRIDEINVLPPEEVAAERKCALEERRNYFVFRHRLASGEERVVEVHSSPIDLSQGRVLFSVIHDMTERRRAEEALRLNEELLSRFIRHSPIYAYVKMVTPGESRVLHASDNFERMIGIPGASMVGKTMTELFPPEFAARTTADDWAVVSGGEVLTLEEELAERTYTTIKFPIVVGEKHLLAGYTIDITERRRMEESIRESATRFRRFFELPLIGTCITSPAKGWLEVNDRLCRMLGYSREELQPLSWADLTHPDDLGADVAEFERVLRGESDGYSMEKRFLRKDGTPVPTALSVSCVRKADSSVDYFVALLEDIAGRKKAEAEIHRLNVELERKVEERTAQLEVAVRELEAFTYSVSHDLRAPLRAIEGFSGILVTECSDRLTAEDQRLLGVVRTNARRMSVLIDDLLEFSRTGRQEVRHGKLGMKLLARSSFEEVVGDPEARTRIDFRLGELPDAEGDPALIRQVWINLLSNAVKFSARQEKPVIEIGSVMEGALEVYHVRDNGAGFDPRFAGKLFGVFQRLHRVEDFEGTGIGLALVKRIVEKHGGRVSALGEVGKGATFSFSLPVPGHVRPDGGPARP